MENSKNIIRKIVQKLIDKEYQSIFEESLIKRVESVWIADEIESYPGNLTLPPIEAFKDFESYDIDNKNEKIIDFFLWFDNEKSDLMIQILIHLDKKGSYSFWDILVP